MKLRKKILGLGLGILTLGALASCGGETEAEFKPIESVYVSSQAGASNITYDNSYTLDELSSVIVKEETFGITFKANEDFIIEDIKFTISTTDLTYSGMNYKISSSKITSTPKIKDESTALTISNGDNTLTLNEEIKANNWFNLLVYTPAVDSTLSNIKISYKKA